jgi:hypothetical protein
MNLNCYLVGDHDYYAAESANQAKQLHMEMNGLDFDEISDVSLVVGELLETQWVDEDTKEPCGTLRKLLSEAKVPCWIAGTE